MRGGRLPKSRGLLVTAAATQAAGPVLPAADRDRRPVQGVAGVRGRHRERRGGVSSTPLLQPTRCITDGCSSARPSSATTPFPVHGHRRRPGRGGRGARTWSWTTTGVGRDRRADASPTSGPMKNLRVFDVSERGTDNGRLVADLCGEGRLRSSLLRRGRGRTCASCAGEKLRRWPCRVFPATVRRLDREGPRRRRVDSASS